MRRLLPGLAVRGSSLVNVGQLAAVCSPVLSCPVHMKGRLSLTQGLARGEAEGLYEYSCTAFLGSFMMYI